VEVILFSVYGSDRLLVGVRMVVMLYILGSTRSGTSALRNAIAETRYRGFGEGHLVPMLVDMIDTVRREKRTGIGHDVSGTGLHHLDPDALLRALFDGYERHLADELECSHILDKTPTVAPIRAAPDLATYHGDAKFIYCARRHVDNVQSKLVKFPEKRLEQHAEEWAACHAAWVDARARLDAQGQDYLELDFFDLATDCEGVAARIGAYLALDRDETDGIARYLTSQRPQAEPGRDLTRFLRLSDLPWSEEQKALFRTIASPVGATLGYGFESYWEAQKSDTFQR